MIIPVLGTGYLNAQKLSKNDAFDILTKWEGKWKSSSVFEKSVWTSDRTENRGTTETNLILLTPTEIVMHSSRLILQLSYPRFPTVKKPGRFH